MPKYYTRVCNFSYGKSSLEKIKNKKSLPLNGNKNISFESVELITNKNRKIISLDKINKLQNNIKKKVKKDLNIITTKKNLEI